MSTIDPITLAKIAAACPGSTPAKQIAAALQLFREAEKALAPAPVSQGDEIDEIMSNQFERIPLDHWLAGIMPKSKKVDRLARYREFIISKLREATSAGPKTSMLYVAYANGKITHGVADPLLAGALAPYIGLQTQPTVSRIREIIDPFAQAEEQGLRIEWSSRSGWNFSPVVEAVIEHLRVNGIVRSDLLREEISRFLQWKEIRDAEVRSTKAKKAALKRHRSKKD